MYQFFIQPDSIKEEEIWIADPQDVNHIRNVLRMKKGEKVSLCCEAKKTSASVLKSPPPCLIHLLQPQHRSHCPQ